MLPLLFTQCRTRPIKQRHPPSRQVFPHQLAIKTILHRHVHRPTDLDKSPLRLPSRVILLVTKLTFNQSSHASIQEQCFATHVGMCRVLVVDSRHDSNTELPQVPQDPDILNGMETPLLQLIGPYSPPLSPLPLGILSNHF